MNHGPHKKQDEHAEKFIQRWEIRTASERATSQSFIIELCELLDVHANRCAGSPT